MGFLDRAVERINESSINPFEKHLVMVMLRALDDDLVLGGYDPEPASI